MDNFKKYGKRFMAVTAAVGVAIAFLLSSIGLPIWLAIIVAIPAAVPATLAIGAAGLKAWLFPNERNF